MMDSIKISFGACLLLLFCLSLGCSSTYDSPGAWGQAVGVERCHCIKTEANPYNCLKQASKSLLKGTAAQKTTEDRVKFMEAYGKLADKCPTPE